MIAIPVSVIPICLKENFQVKLNDKDMATTFNFNRTWGWGGTFLLPETMNMEENLCYTTY